MQEISKDIRTLESIRRISVLYKSMRYKLKWVNISEVKNTIEIVQKSMEKK